MCLKLAEAVVEDLRVQFRHSQSANDQAPKICYDDPRAYWYEGLKASFLVSQKNSATLTNSASFIQPPNQVGAFYNKSWLGVWTQELLYSQKYSVWLKIQLKIEFTLMLLRTGDKSINRNELRRFILNNSGADILGNIN